MRYLLLYSIMIPFLSLSSCKDADKKTSTEPLTAEQIAKKYIIADGHVDLPYRLKIKNFKLEREFLEIPIQTKEGDFDYVRAKQGGLDAPFMSIYLPSSYQETPGSSKILADSLISMIEGITEAHPDKFKIAFNPKDCEEAFAAGKIALPMGMENGSGIEADLRNVAHFRKRGISYITLTHGKDNLISDSSYDTQKTHGGLSAYGKKVVEEMNKEGIMVDISHVSDDAFYQAVELSKVPVIASHSSCRKYTPGFQRNMSDDMIKKLGEKNGVICINFGSTFLDGKIRSEQDKQREELREIITKAGFEMDSEEAKPIIEEYRNAHPNLFSDVVMVANHIDHVVAIAGIDHVGLGSDYDGVGDSLPVGLKDVSQYPNLIAELMHRGYSEEDIAKICSGNLFRVWQQAVDYAAAH